MEATVISTNISLRKGVKKQAVSAITIDRQGAVDDAHRGSGLRQISILSREIIEEFAGKAGRSFAWGDFAENITTSGLDLRNVAILDRMQIGDAELEITQIGKECHGKGCAIFKEVGACVMPEDGVFCRVTNGGVVKSGDIISHIEVPLKLKVITLSDRASCGEYEDVSGLAIRQTLDKLFTGKRYRIIISRVLIPDDADKLRAEVIAACSEGVAALFTTGGTGIGPRDITPDVLIPLLDKQIPGPMEYVRIKYGERNPAVLLSRSIAGTRGQTLIFAMPGSPKAVAEYMEVICSLLFHSMQMVRGIDSHAK
ncbi:MAG: molybdenum cofactor synthesis domain-containing protein [bacterium]